MTGMSSMIFDECHRSQFGDMHADDHPSVQALQPLRFHRHADLRRQRRHQRQPAACGPPSRPSATTLHTLHASSMRSATRTCCRSASTTSTPIKAPAGIKDKKVSAIDTERRTAGAGAHRARSSATSCEHFDQKTKRTEQLPLDGQAAGAASTHCSRPPPSTPPSATTPSSPSQQKDAARRDSGSRSV